MLTYRNPNTNRSISPSQFTTSDVKSATEHVQKRELCVGVDYVLQNVTDENTCPCRAQSPVKRQKVSECEKPSLSPKIGNGVASLARKLANPVTKTQVETRKTKLRQSTSSDERIDSDEEENVIKRRRFNALADILTLKKLEHLPIAKRIISIHKKDKRRLSGVKKIEKRINKQDTFTWNIRREVISLPMRTLREQTFEKAKNFRDIAAKCKRQAFRRIARKEEELEGKGTREEDDEYSEAVLKEAAAIMHKEVPDLIAAECIINTHKKHKDRLNKTDNNGYARKPYPTMFVRCRHSEPVNLLRLRILNEAEDLKDYTDLRRAAVKLNMKNKLARVDCEIL
ncbi:hypothetical protein PRIPAC_85756 [Pristionchus pacificus]|uniref:Uncharacterized protein n=1 Tax=Pristionchus pacificus TaxID=54126 RepID=A0A454XSH1_PRIPA|nr:hypothetical protein PRIPAC_85756 [Pristionchus pacificus]|eukprot:PDM69055.1 hypothetical protein PRIPAC_47357 [Pristionchus pacificus]